MLGILTINPGDWRAQQSWWPQHGTAVSWPAQPPPPAQAASVRPVQILAVCVIQQPIGCWNIYHLWIHTVAPQQISNFMRWMIIILSVNRFVYQKSLDVVDSIVLVCCEEECYVGCAGRQRMVGWVVIHLYETHWPLPAPRNRGVPSSGRKDGISCSVQSWITSHTRPNIQTPTIEAR